MAKIADFNHDPKNANKGTARGQKQIVSSIQASGVGRSIVTDKNGVIIGGNKSLEAMAEIFGVEAEPIVIKSDGKRPLIHVREDLDLDDPDPNNPARKLAYNDNVTSWLSFELDPEVVSLDMKAGFDFQAIGVSLEELGEMLEGGVRELLKGNGQPKDVEPQINKADELRQKYGVELGQVWELGQHRIICGDCTDPAVVVAVMGGEKASGMITDPPYGVDKAEWDDIFPGLEVWEHHRSCLTEGANAVIFPGEANLPFKVEILFKVFSYQWPVIWYKPNAMQFGKTGYCVQSIAWWLSVGEPTTRPKFRDVIVDAIVPKNNDFGHPSPKNLNVIAELVEQFTSQESLVYEPYLGSGTTLIACENLNRKCRGIEIDPGYVGVTLERASGIGLTPQRVSG